MMSLGVVGISIDMGSSEFSGTDFLGEQQV
jgi:hypothetical protein